MNNSPNKNLPIDEFRCKCCGEVRMEDPFLERLGRARKISGVPYPLLSGYRCPKHNKDVGSTSTNHTSGRAADIRTINGSHRMQILVGLILAGFRRIGIYPDTTPPFIHVDDMDMVESCWIKLKKGR